MDAISIERATEPGQYGLILQGMQGPIEVELFDRGAAGMMVRVSGLDVPVRYVKGALLIPHAVALSPRPDAPGLVP